VGGSDTIGVVVHGVLLLFCSVRHDGSDSDLIHNNERRE
jgi:hypothetical protein